jgi:hypothetical protein
MRAIFIAFVVVPALAGCGEGSSFDEGFKKAYREKGIAACVEATRRQSPLGAASIDVEELCACTVDKVMEGKSANDLMTPDEKAEKAAVEQCLAKAMTQKKA